MRIQIEVPPVERTEIDKESGAAHLEIKHAFMRLFDLLLEDAGEININAPNSYETI